MTSKTFLRKLRFALTFLPKEERQTTVSYYEEMISDRIEAGENEEKAIESLGSVKEIARSIRLESEEKTGKKHSPLVGILLIAGSPFWLVWIVVAMALAISLVVVVWALLISIYAVELSFAAVAVGGVIGFFVRIGESAGAAFAMLGVGLVFAALAILLFSPIVALTKHTALALTQACRSLYLRLTGKKPKSEKMNAPDSKS